MKNLEISQLIVKHLDDRSVQGIARGMASLIHAGALPVGTKLPPVRDLAELLGISPGTVSAAWKQLRNYRLLAGGGRNGVWIQGEHAAQRPTRFEGSGTFNVYMQTDLRQGTPDLVLLPRLDHALAKSAGEPNLHSYRREPIIQSLLDEVRPNWPYKAPAFMATNGGFDGVHLAMASGLMAGSSVAIEDPTSIRFLDMLDVLGLRPIGVACDDEGPTPESLRKAITLNASAFVYQPGTHAVTGRQVTPQRMKQLAKVLMDSQVLVIEDDGLNLLSKNPTLSMGALIPDRTIHVRSYSKSLGPDLRIGIASGPARLMEQFQSFRNFREGWTSRILQSTLAWMLKDKDVAKSIQHARDTYEKRRQALSVELTQRGVAHTGGPLSLWIPVHSEHYALVTLASRGIAARPGNPTQLEKIPHIWVATSLLTSQYAEIAAAIADSACSPQSAAQIASPD